MRPARTLPFPERPKLSARLSLTDFFSAYVEPCWLSARGANPRTLAEYRTTMDYWRRSTGDPPLGRLTDYHGADFLRFLRELPGRSGNAQASAFTVRKHVRNAQTCLCLAGPRDGTHRHAQRLIADVPWLDPPPVDYAAPSETFTLDELGQILAAAGQGPRPAPSGPPPGVWWRGLVLLGYNTAERRGALLSVRWSDYDESARVLYFPRGIRKGRARSHTVPLNRAALAALDSLRCGRPVAELAAAGDRILPCAYLHQWVLRAWQRLLAAAGLPPERRFTLHALRRTAATAAVRLGPAAAQLLLGHADYQTTRRHYTNLLALADAVEAMPQPANCSETPNRSSAARRRPRGH